MSEQKTKTNEKRRRIATKVIKGAIPGDTAFCAYEFFKDNVEWEEGVKSKNGNTRLAKAFGIDDDRTLKMLIENALIKIADEVDVTSLEIYSVYLNYYADGSMYTPNHRHADTMQIIISLGATRTLVVGKKSYAMESGDVAIFGSSVHGVPKDDCKDGRISVAIFVRV